MAAIDVQALEREYKSGLKAVRGIDLAVSAGEVYGFLGPNGAGKTTTVRMLVTLLRPTGGTVTVAGFDVATEPAQVRKRIGVALQEAALDQLMTGRELMELPGHPARHPAAGRARSRQGAHRPRGALPGRRAPGRDVLGRDAPPPPPDTSFEIVARSVFPSGCAVTQARRSGFVMPGLGRRAAEAHGGRRADDERGDAIAVLECELLSDHAAHRDAHEVGALDPGGVQHSEDVADELLHAQAAPDPIRLPVPRLSSVIARTVGGRLRSSRPQAQPAPPRLMTRTRGSPSPCSCQWIRVPSWMATVTQRTPSSRGCLVRRHAARPRRARSRPDHPGPAPREG